MLSLGPLIINNPAGLWALLGVPALVMIHFLQRKLTRVPVSTGFLLDHIAFQSPEGSRFERFRSSLPFWLQLLAVLILAALLSGLDWRQTRPLRRVAIVMDGSASMAVSRERAADAVTSLLQSAAGDARLDITVTASDSERDVLYRGDQPQEVASALERWLPLEGTHDPADALRTARALVGDAGAVFFVTDQVPTEPLPYAAHFLAVGEAMDNVGITAVRVVGANENDRRIEAMLYQFGENETSVEWSVAFPELDRESTPRAVTIAAGGAVKVEAGLPPSVTRAVVVVRSSDGFALDNVAPVVVPQPKHLAVAASSEVDPAALAFWQRIVGALENVEWTSDATTADVTVRTRRSKSDGHSVLHLPASGERLPIRTEAITSAVHPLVDELNWQALAPRMRDGFTPASGSAPLLWQGEHPLAWIERDGGHRALVMNLNPDDASGVRDPSLVVLCARFLQRVRESLPRPESLLSETDVALKVVLPERAPQPGAKPPLYEWTVTPVGAAAQSVWLGAHDLRGLPTPRVPGWYALRDDAGTPVVDGAAWFSDTREMNFLNASSMSDVPADVFAAGTASDGVVGRDVSLILLALVALMLGLWYVMRGKDGREASEPSVLVTRAK
ncbi:vWA domain-containing protein [Sulfuriroseicoccus oceanibius]|uniref:VWA domain-containing protein n=1 Tax=Sulfuriroseicoccus oceanibius TaxID=2707525 RepID=A0A6B3LC24_9BACT|nr:VWA domain-containing protein [Sulfuriroseicoccus oceanibius]QQL45109.1 VWA domain-containing protein [Sulfuriroseicoccus oceanibius]